MERKFLTAEWRNLIMANYIIDPKLLLPYLPLQTELDKFNGEIYASLVGFLFAETKLMGVKIPFHVNFEEVNLRFYVRYKDGNNWKRGVTFIKEIVPKPAITFIANSISHEKYCTMPMQHFYEDKENEKKVAYTWKLNNKWNQLMAITENIAVPMQPGSEEQFIAEHYWGYSKYNDKTTFEYAVQHPEWKVYPVKEFLVDCNFGALYGDPFSYLKNEIPSSVFMAQGSAVEVLNKRQL
jgi:uncharacterized protein YqjF (DUF2071 family)